MNWLRSVLAVLALTMRMFPDALPDQAAMNRNAWVKLFMLIYTLVCVACGGYVTAWMARRSEARHAVIMGVIEAAMTVWVISELRGHAPLWSGIVGAVLVVPAAWYGGMIRVKRAAL